MAGNAGVTVVAVGSSPTARAPAPPPLRGPAARRSARPRPPPTRNAPVRFDLQLRSGRRSACGHHHSTCLGLQDQWDLCVNRRRARVRRLTGVQSSVWVSSHRHRNVGSAHAPGMPRVRGLARAGCARCAVPGGDQAPSDAFPRRQRDLGYQRPPRTVTAAGTALRSSPASASPTSATVAAEPGSRTRSAARSRRDLRPVRIWSVYVPNGRSLDSALPVQARLAGGAAATLS